MQYVKDPTEVEPTITPVKGERNETLATHPAFASIGAFRAHGGNWLLYGSDFIHSNTINIRISASEVKRGLSNDWFHSGGRYIEVELTESQWANFVSAMNVGEGTPCTLRRLKGVDVPGIKSVANRKKQFAGEVSQAMKDSIKSIELLSEMISANPKLTAKVKAEMISQARQAMERVAGTIPFVTEQFDEHMERTVAKAKNEIHAHAMLVKAGLVLSDAPVPLLEDHSDEVGK
mgnify:CR=1 FL=1